MARDPQRIDDMMDFIGNYWKANPDLRLGQIVANAVRAKTGLVNCDPFYVEDDELLEGLKHVAKS